MSLNKIRQHSRTERYLFLEAGILLGLARLALRLLPFQKIARRISQAVPNGRPKVLDSQTLLQIGWAVNAAARHAPWDSACLAQALTAHWMLERRGLASTIYLGVKRDDQGRLCAHAWLKAGGQILTGESGHEEFTVLATFPQQTSSTSGN